MKYTGNMEGGLDMFVLHVSLEDTGLQWVKMCHFQPENVSVVIFSQ